MGDLHILGILLVVWNLAWGQADNGDLTVSACFNQSSSSLAATCDSGSMVQLEEVIFGYSPTGACSYSPGDCTLADQEIHHCVGRSVCELNLPTGDLGRSIPKCQKRSNYMEISYKCIPANSVVDICSQEILTEQSGYIVTPRYPNNYPASKQCQLSIQSHISQDIRLYNLDMDLNCSDSLYAKGTLRSSTWCGRKGPQKLWETFQNELTLEFTSKSEGKNKGFWLYYEAIPPLPPTTTVQQPTDVATVLLWQDEVGQSNPTPSSSGQGEGLVTEPPDTRQTHKHDSYRLPVEAIVGAVIGSLVLLLLVLLILLIIKRRKEREMTSSTSTCHLHGKGGSTVHTSGTTGPYIQNNLDHMANPVV